MTCGFPKHSSAPDLKFAVHPHIDSCHIASINTTANPTVPSHTVPFFADVVDTNTADGVLEELVALAVDVIQRLKSIMS